jgi:outer membrane protein assembly factor BamB
MLVLAVVAASVALVEEDPAIEHPRSGVGTRLSEALPIRLRAGDGFGALTVASGDVWAHDYGREQLVRLDGRSGRVLARVSLGRRFALAAGEGSLWALRWGGRSFRWPNGPLFRIDPATNRVAARIPLRAPSGEPMIGFGVLVGEGGVWVWGPSRVLRLDPSSGRVQRELSAGADRPELTSAVLHAGGLLAVSADGQLVRFDLRRRVRRGAPEPALATAELLAAVGDRVLGAVDGTLIAADAWTGRVQWRRPLGFRVSTVVESGGVLLAHGGALGDRGDRVWAIEPATGRVLAGTVIPSLGTTSMVVVEGSLWLATSAGEVIVLPRLITDLFVRRARSAD